ncbi:MAG: glycosyltransferase [Candidatus Rokubacteria bacterium]|nr:glycosyltransferase [Candidatus Rokubacteria bacterium]
MTALAIFHTAIGTTLAGLALHTLVNHLTLPRLRRMPAAARLPRVSVLIPARNEAGRIGASVRGWAAQEYPDYEVLVYDDASTDATARQARAAAGSASHVRVIRGGPLPAGWRGKPWACHRLRAHARGEILVFADADVVPVPETLTRAAGALTTLAADAVSAVPSHTSPSLAVRALVAIQNWAALTFVPSWLAPTRRRRMFAAMTGQFVAIRAEVYDASGGFGADRLALAEDVALGRRLTALGYRVRLLDGAGMLRCQAYASVREAWQAAGRNLLPVFFDSPVLLLLALTTLAVIYLGPVIVLALGLALGQGPTSLWTWAPLAEIALGLATRLVADRRAGYALWLAFLQPVAVGALLAMGVDSVTRFRVRRVVEWRDRRYDVAERAASAVGR